MNRFSRMYILPAVLCLAYAGTARAGDLPVKGPAELQGCWKLVSVETNGKSGDPVGGGQPRWVVKGDAVYYGGEAIIRLTADPSTTPPVIHLKFRDPDRVYEGVYSVEKDTLKVCLNGRADAKERPGDFTTKDRADRRLLVFEREAAAPANPAEGAIAYAGVQLRADAETKAVVVDTPIRGSPAEKAGLKKGDVILMVGTTEATGLEATVKAVRQARPGDRLEIRIKRDGKESTIAVAVGVLPFHWAAGLD
jgi:uncharacterized protein (TIGR03067 family)